MIQREALVKIGKFHKPHGMKGELSFSFTDDSFDEGENPFLICELDGIFVPFRLEEYRFISGSAALVKLKTIDSDSKARRLTNREVYFPKNRIRTSGEDEIQTWDYFVGFALIDKKLGEIGTVSSVDDSTLNTLFIIDRNDEELLIPAAEEMITYIDEAGKKIYLTLPEGLFDTGSI
ncbi:MAG: ribosome maturation factor RimM [Dysgonamonadaceae bacterium]|jgi:16S rRNA processing protein RimM|nr:ribosome maturation factor RimM [Dysgonamonadaceae bacterium]